MEIQKCLQLIFDIFKDFSRFFNAFPLTKTNTNSLDNQKENELIPDQIQKEILKKNMLNFYQNLNDTNKNIPEIINENILISNFLDIIFDEVKSF